MARLRFRKWVGPVPRPAHRPRKEWWVEEESFSEVMLRNYQKFYTDEHGIKLFFRNSPQFPKVE